MWLLSIEIHGKLTIVILRNMSLWSVVTYQYIINLKTAFYKKVTVSCT